MSDEISVHQIEGNRIGGRFVVNQGVVTVTISGGRSRTAHIDGSMLSVETLAKTLLLQLNQDKMGKPAHAKGVKL